MPRGLPHLPTLCLTLAQLGAQAGIGVPCEGPLRGPLGREYWLIAPPSTTPEANRHLVVLAHGFRGKGSDILWLHRAFARFSDCIFVAPSFREGFQLLRQRADEQVIKLARILSRRFKLKRRIFVCGFSAGAQFAHRFAMRHPERVSGCSAHSGGTWGPDLNPAARAVPMSLSCGLEDTARSSLGQTMGRAEAAERYFRKLARSGFHIKARLWQGLGHSTSLRTEQLIAECYALANQGRFLGHEDQQGTLPPKPSRRSLLGRLDRQRLHFGFVMQGLGGRNQLGDQRWVDDGGENLAGWVDNPAAQQRRRELLTATRAAAANRRGRAR